MKGLRPRLIATFALVAAVASAALAVTSYAIVRSNVLERATDTAIEQTQTRVAEAAARLPAGASPTEVRFLMTQLPGSGGTGVLVVGDDGSSDASPSSLTPAAVPPALTDLPAGQLRWVRTGDRIVVGARIPGGPRLYQFFALAAVTSDLEVLRNVLAGVGVALVSVSALVGVAAARGLLRPLRRARQAANRIEAGKLDTRLPEEGRDEFTDLARSFNRMAGALERTLAGQRRFVSDVSHELRTPLTALTTAADVLEANADGLNDQGRRAAHLLVLESRRLAEMVEDLMEISRFDAGVPAMAWEPVDVGRLVKGALEARGWSDRVGVAAAGDAETYADARRLDTIVANLVGNALEHGAPPVTVTVGSGAGGTVVVAVDDSGPGIPASQREQIFDRFYKGDPSRSRGGSGLGLAIARENAALHGGRITVESLEGHGSRFSLVLPRRDAPPAT